MSYCQDCADRERELNELQKYLATETAAIQKVRDEMAVIRMKFPGWEPESLKVQPAMVPVGKLHDWLAALDAIIQKRTNA